jgi:hypothetical protein
MSNRFEFSSVINNIHLMPDNCICSSSTENGACHANANLKDTSTAPAVVLIGLEAAGRNSCETLLMAEYLGVSFEVSRIGADCGDSDDIESDGNVSSNSNGSTSSLSEGSKECAVDVGDASSGEAADARSRNVERHSKIEDKCGVSSGGSGGGDGRISGGVDLWSEADWAANIYGRKGDGLDEYRAYGEYS